MTPQEQQQINIDPWTGKGERFRLIAVLTSVLFFIFAVYDGGSFHARYMQQCMAEPERAECKPLNLVREERPPDLGVILYYDKGKWALDIGPRQAEEQSSELASHLKTYGIEPRVIKVRGKGKTTWCQVQIGRFLSRKSAVEAGTQLQSKGVVQSFSASSYQVSN
jgi:hypothetical protein